MVNYVNLELQLTNLWELIDVIPSNTFSFSDITFLGSFINIKPTST